jgi:hypothetical protein
MLVYREMSLRIAIIYLAFCTLFFPSSFTLLNWLFGTPAPPLPPSRRSVLAKSAPLAHGAPRLCRSTARVPFFPLCSACDEKSMPVALGYDLMFIWL